MSEELTHVVVTTGELVPEPHGGFQGRPMWEYGEGEVNPQTGEVIGAGGYSTIICTADVLPVREFERLEPWWVRIKRWLKGGSR